MTAAPKSEQVVALCGGIGGAKLALGLYRILGGDRLTIVVNTGDDFEQLDLHISPDIDTVIYTLAGLADPDRGWGRVDETWQFMGALRGFVDDAWFNLGDRDLAMHVLRTEWLRRGEGLTAFTKYAAARTGVTARILPMTDGAVRTIVETRDGDMAFQDYFVRRKCEPTVHAIRFQGANTSSPTREVFDALAGPVRAIVICPSNPFLSVDPILSVPGLRSAIEAHSSPVVAVSPLVGGQAVKGPTTKIMAELGLATTTQSIADHYEGLIDGLVIDGADAAESVNVDIPLRSTQTLMRSLEDRERLARDVLEFCQFLTRSSTSDRVGTR